MAYHKYKVGQLVNFSPSRPGMPTASGQYEIVRQLPAESGEFQYRVKSKGETFERMAERASFRDAHRRDGSPRCYRVTICNPLTSPIALRVGMLPSSAPPRFAR